MPSIFLNLMLLGGMFLIAGYEANDAKKHFYYSVAVWLWVVTLFLAHTASE
jgi:hypothetical protein